MTRCLSRITGYGSDDARAGYDAVIQAEAGFQYMNGPPGSFPDASPTKMPVALMDLLAAHQLKEAGAPLPHQSKRAPKLRKPYFCYRYPIQHRANARAVLVALWDRERNYGAGCFVEVSLIQAGVSALANQATGYLVAGVIPE